MSRMAVVVAPLVRRGGEVLGAGASAVALVVAVTLANAFFSQSGRDQVSVYVTAVSLLAPLCAFGFDQVFFRTHGMVTIADSRFRISEPIAWNAVLTIVGAVAVAGAFSCSHDLLLGLAVGSSVVLHAAVLRLAVVERLSGNFQVSVHWNGFWRYGCLVGVLLGAAMKNESLSMAAIAMSNLLGSVFAANRMGRGRVEFERDGDRGALRLASGYLFAACVMSLLSLMDRLVVGHSADWSGSFSDYVLFATIFVYPFTFLAGALAPVLTQHLKAGRPGRAVAIELAVWVLLSSLVFGVLYLASTHSDWTLRHIAPLIADRWLVLASLALVLVRVAYAGVSALFSVSADPKGLMVANVASLLLAGIMLAFSSSFSSISAVILASAAIWLTRSVLGVYVCAPGCRP
jgi:hypothetical protein